MRQNLAHIQHATPFYSTISNTTACTSSPSETVCLSVDCSRLFAYYFPTAYCNVGLQWWPSIPWRLQATCLFIYFSVVGLPLDCAIGSAVSAMFQHHHQGASAEFTLKAHCAVSPAVLSSSFISYPALN